MGRNKSSKAGKDAAELTEDRAEAAPAAVAEVARPKVAAAGGAEAAAAQQRRPRGWKAKFGNEGAGGRPAPTTLRYEREELLYVRQLVQAAGLASPRRAAASAFRCAKIPGGDASPTAEAQTPPPKQQRSPTTQPPQEPPAPQPQKPQKLSLEMYLKDAPSPGAGKFSWNAEATAFVPPPGDAADGQKWNTKAAAFTPSGVTAVAPEFFPGSPMGAAGIEAQQLGFQGPDFVASAAVAAAAVAAAAVMAGTLSVADLAAMLAAQQSQLRLPLPLPTPTQQAESALNPMAAEFRPTTAVIADADKPKQEQDRTPPPKEGGSESTSASSGSNSAREEAEAGCAQS